VGQDVKRAPALTGNVQMMTSYTAFARFYDAVQGERAEHAAHLRELIDWYHPSARTVLELEERHRDHHADPHRAMRS
jgi:hypothetical protein